MPLKIRTLRYFGLFLIVFVAGCYSSSKTSQAQSQSSIFSSDIEKRPVSEIESLKIQKLLESAEKQTTLTKTYDPAYVVLSYPNGDVPIEKGVCTDVVIRALRNAGVDLQKDVHEDMSVNFSKYSTRWGLKSPDKNIDHRRVLNLETYFTKIGKSLKITDKAENFLPGDIVSWDLDGKGLTHIGLVSNQFNKQTKRFLIIHNIGGGTVAEDRLFDWEITGHFRYF